MELNKLKEQILNKKPINSLLVFEYEEDTFLCKEYYEAIASNMGYSVQHINSLDDLVCLNNVIYVYNNETIDVIPYEVREMPIIVVCKKCKDETVDVVKFPKLQEWQLQDYANVKCPGLTDKERSWLVKTTKNVYRLENELSKISLFSPANQERVFKELNSNDQYSDLSSYSLFDLSNAVMKRNVDVVESILEEDHSIESMQLLGLLVKNFKNVIDIQINSRSTPDSLGMSFKQFNAIKYNCGYYSEVELRKIYKTLTEIDYKLKTGAITTDVMVDYLLIKVLGV